MATVRVRALSTVHGLRYGEEATIPHTPMVDLLLEGQKLALIPDHPGTTTDLSGSPEPEAPASTEAAELGLDLDPLYTGDEPDADPESESESTDPEPAADEAPRARKRGRSAKEPSDTEVT